MSVGSSEGRQDEDGSTDGKKLGSRNGCRLGIVDNKLGPSKRV